MAMVSMMVPQVSGIDICLFHRMTGLPCPGCGMTRSVVALLHGNVSEALAFNVGGPLVLLVAAFLMVAGVLSRGRRHAWRAAVRRLELRYAWVEHSMLALFVLYGLGRIVLIGMGFVTLR
ncbi:MAG: DUF2752 domain-containing protein [Candidatus Xenobia bacterium]